MNLREKYKEDIASIMAKINHNGGELWATKDRRICKGSPFSTRDVAIMLSELGFTKKDTIIQDIAELIFSTWKPDGRFKISPSGAIYPCHTIGIARVLCYLGYSEDNRIKKTVEHLLKIQQEDGGWKCNKFSFGRGPETKYSNPGPTLEALDAFRFTDLINSDKRLDKAVDFLLWHWEVKKPIGPCQYGIGSLFKKTEFPFFRYNLFYYCYTLSFYTRAHRDKRFNDALTLLRGKVKNGNMIVENPNRQLANMDFCRKEQPSELATIKFNDLMRNIKD
ncbi:MAG: hypothetical protein JXJ22_15035 [Bacteroidales bacterium]|nr:hypothetical protein [Bacteroidales bacterium]